LPNLAQVGDQCLTVQILFVWEKTFYIKHLKDQNDQKLIISKIYSTANCNLILNWAIADEGPP
jgi:hypothetical protein